MKDVAPRMKFFLVSHGQKLISCHRKLLHGKLFYIHWVRYRGTLGTEKDLCGKIDVHCGNRV